MNGDAVGGGGTRRPISSVAVFCGSNPGDSAVFVDAARSLGAELARRRIVLVFGGTHMGLMGALADAHLAGGGEAHGVITTRLHEKGHLHPRLTRHEIVADMALRKQRMAELADAFIALPGGMGTLEELMEVMVLNQLGYFDKPAGMLNVDGFHDRFLGFVDHMVERSFLPADHRRNVISASQPGALIDALVHHEKSTVSKWL